MYKIIKSYEQSQPQNFWYGRSKGLPKIIQDTGSGGSDKGLNNFFGVVHDGVFGQICDGVITFFS